MSHIIPIAIAALILIVAGFAFAIRKNPEAKAAIEKAEHEVLFEAADALRKHRRDIAALLYEVLMRDDANGPTEGSFEDLDKGGKQYHLTRVGVVVEALQLLATRMVEVGAKAQGKALPPLTLEDVLGRPAAPKLELVAPAKEEKTGQEKSDEPLPPAA